MRADWYVKGVLTVIAVALMAIAANLWTGRLPLRAAEAQTPIPRAELTVPRAWGKLLTYSNGNLLLEAPDGSLRVVDVDGRPPEYPKLKALIKWN
jgi:hypothetical protein